jgi:carbonic anhydrase/acetyltransferase-like protein (isoleucine patch superfamily)
MCVWQMTPSMRYVRRMPQRQFDGISPQIDPESYLDPTAVVIGTAVILAGASLWPYVVIRADTDRITVGASTNVQDGAIVHCDRGVPCHIGARVTIGHRAIVHGCTIEDEVLIGMGAIIMNHARIGSGSIIGAGAVVTEGTIVPPGSLVRGTPGRIARVTTEDERAGIIASAQHYREMARRHGIGATN